MLHNTSVCYLAEYLFAKLHYGSFVATIVFDNDGRWVKSLN
jgi:hypothetical protein